MQFYYQHIMSLMLNLALGEATSQLLVNILLGVGGVLATAGGTFLIAWVGLKDVINGWRGETKDVKKILLGLATVVAGGAIITMGVMGILNIGNSLGADFGISV